MVSDRQIKYLFKTFNQGGNVSMSALKADVDRKTARKYLHAAQLPSQVPRPHAWRTRPDPFAAVQEEIHQLLEGMPELQGTTLLRYLQAQYPGRFADSQLRTLQRLIQQWRREEGPDQEVFFAQTHRPGVTLQLDWFSMKALQITIQGQPYDHLLCHGVLLYSNWEWARPCRSESFLSLKQTVQEALFQVGGVPQYLETDNSSSATHQVQRGHPKRTLNTRYTSLLAHYGLQARTINVGCPHENGTVEAQHGHLRRRLDQALLLRGPRDFERDAAYHQFVHTQVHQANGNRREKVAQEQQTLRPLPPRPLPDYEEEMHRVGSGATLRVGKATYSVPSRLCGAQVKVRLYDDRLEVYVGRTQVHQMPRAVGPPAYVIDYRHVIHTLVRKVGAFADYTYREALFPTPVFRQAYTRLHQGWDARQADQEYLHLLKVAAEQGQAPVEAILTRLLEVPERRPTLEQVKAELEGERPPWPGLSLPEVTLAAYDGLLSTAAEVRYAPLD